MLRRHAAFTALVPLLAPALALAWCVGGAPPARDGDLDDLNDIQEQLVGTDPADPDSDDDGVGDGVEDRDGDGILNRDEPHVFSLELFEDPFAARRLAVVLEGPRLFDPDRSARRATVLFPDADATRRARMQSRLNGRTRVYLRLGAHAAAALLGPNGDGRVRIANPFGDTNTLRPMPMHCMPGAPMLMGAALVELRTPGVPDPLVYVVIGGCPLLDLGRRREVSARVRLADGDIAFHAPYGGAALLPTRILVPQQSRAVADPTRPLWTPIQAGDAVAVVTADGSSAPVFVEPPIAQLRIPAGDTQEDHDGDDLQSARELELGTDPLVWDTDRDGLNDGQEVRNGTDPRDPDSDGDGVVDGEE